jgi:transposase
MTAPIAGIDPHQDQFTIGIVDAVGVEVACETYPNTGGGFVAAIDLLVTHGVDQVGIEGSASWGTHVAIAVVAAGFDAREVPPQRSATQRRSRRLAKTDAIDAVATARALLAEPTLGQVQTLEVYDPLVAELEAVLEHRRALVEARTLLLHHVGDQLAKLPIELRDQLPTTGKLESRLRRLATIATTGVSTRAGAYRVSWLMPLIDQDRQARRQIRQLERRIEELLDEHGTTLRDEPGVGPITAATLVLRGR